MLCPVLLILVTAAAAGAASSLPAMDIPRDHLRTLLSDSNMRHAIGKVGSTGIRLRSGDSPSAMLDEYITCISKCFGITATIGIVQQHSETVYQNAFGARDVERGIPADNETIFQIGSTTKVCMLYLFFLFFLFLCYNTTRGCRQCQWHVHLTRLR